LSNGGWDASSADLCSAALLDLHLPASERGARARERSGKIEDEMRRHLQVVVGVVARTRHGMGITGCSLFLTPTLSHLCSRGYF
jgi:hypothetical protein